MDLTDRMRAAPMVAALMEVAEGDERLHLVGGAVRDLLLGDAPVDLDVVVEGDSVTAAQRLAERLGGEVRVHDRFGTATVSAGDLTFDVAMARRERYPEPGALPEVEPATLEEDLPRRDFTVNALAAALAGPERGVLRAPPGALEDLEGRRLRVFHDASFLDDPTRLLRLVRYGARLDFAVEAWTAELAHDAVSTEALRTVSGPRIGAELRLLAREKTAVEALERAWGLGLVEAVDERLELDAGLVSRALALAPAEARGAVVLGACCRYFDGADLPLWLDWLESGAAERDATAEAALEGPMLVAPLAAARSNAAIARAVGRRRPATVALAGALGAEENARRWLDDLRHVRLEISGSDLLEAGVEPGPAVGRGLAAALEAKLDGRATSRDEELRVALDAA